MEFSVMSYNIEVGRGSDLSTISATIGEADIVAVQEIGVDWFEGIEGNQPQLLTRASGLPHVRFTSVLTAEEEEGGHRVRMAPNSDARPGLGFALFSRFTLGPWTRHRLPKGQTKGACILSATVVTPKGPISLMVTQLSPSPKDRQIQVPSLLRHIQTQPSPLILMGDLGGNASEDDALSMLSPYLGNAAGPEGSFPSFPASDPSEARDHIFLTKEFEVLEAAMPLPLMGSRHLPIMAKLKL